MVVTINTNQSALIALRNLTATNRELDEVQKRVATGLKVSGAEDDSGIFSVAQSLRADVNGYDSVAQSVARARRLFDVSRHAFRPVPGVDSTVIRIRPLDPPPLTREEEEGLRSLTRAAFQWRRKQFQTTLRKHPRYRLSRDEVAAVEEETGFDLRRRPERFSPRELLRLAGALEARGRPRRPGP